MRTSSSATAATATSDEDSGEYMESNDAGWDYDDEYYDDYDPWSDPGDGWGDYSDDEDGWGDYF